MSVSATFRWIVPRLFLFLFTTAAAQASFEDRVRSYEEADRLRLPREGATLLIGSSTIEGWVDAPQSFPRTTIINRGLSGSTYRELLEFEGRIIYPYRPGRVVIYSGDNDIGAGRSPELIAHQAAALLDHIHAKAPAVPVLLLSVKPSPLRVAKLATIRETNAALRAVCDSRHWTRFISIYDLMVDARGLPRRELFRKDRLHMNAKGYALWARRLRPFLED